MAYYAYVRVSTTEQAEDDKSSLDDQARMIEYTAKARGETITQVFRDPGVSAAIPLRQRPAGKLLLESMKPGESATVFEYREKSSEA